MATIGEALRKLIEENERMYDAIKQVTICEEELKEKVRNTVLARFRQRKIFEEELGGVTIGYKKKTWEYVKEWEEEFENSLEGTGVE